MHLVQIDRDYSRIEKQSTLFQMNRVNSSASLSPKFISLVLLLLISFTCRHGAYSVECPSLDLKRDPDPPPSQGPVTDSQPVFGFSTEPFVPH
jgi:hypothetical protein